MRGAQLGEFLILDFDELGGCVALGRELKRKAEYSRALLITSGEDATADDGIELIAGEVCRGFAVVSIDLLV